MPLPPSQPSTCAQCGQPLKPGQAAVGCLHCLLGEIGGPDEATVLHDSPQPPATDAGTRYHHYEVLRREDGTAFELGRGGMGVTYKAEDVNLRVPVALKVIDADYARHPRARELFLREARSAARLRHPNVATVYHFGTLEPEPAPAGSLVEEEPAGAACFYAMEFVDGETLDARVRRAGPLPPGEALEIALQVARALVAAEERGLVHRDLKPANVMLAGQARCRERAWVKVIDFGLAKAVSDAALADGGGPATVTHGAFVGTPGYASPEQFKRAELDVRSDVYSLGATLWFALTGRLPYEGGTLAEVHDRQTHRPLPVAQLTDLGTPAPLVELLKTMLAPDPAQRPTSAGALCEAVERCLARVGGKSPRGGRRLPVALAALVLLGGVAALAAFHPWRRAAVPASAVVAPAKPAAPAVPEKSLAVLPFEDLSADKGSAFLADGVQDEVLTDLAKVADLKVISRSSVVQYQAGAPRNLRAIAGLLGVAYVVEGSVQRDGKRLRVNARLVDPRTDATPWAEHYDRSLEDVFVLQSDIAEAIAHQLQTRLSPEEKRAIEAPATADLVAYELYARARTIYEVNEATSPKLADAVPSLEEAVARDPKFLPAWCLLVNIHSHLFQRDKEAADSEKAHAALQQALALAPDAGEVHLSQAIYDLQCLHDRTHGRAELEAARHQLPNDATVYRWLGALDRNQGQMEESVVDFEKSLSLDPRNAGTVALLSALYRNLRRYDDETRALDRMLAFVPDDLDMRLERSRIALYARADCKPHQLAVATALAANPSDSADSVDPDETLCERTPGAAALVLANLTDRGTFRPGAYPYEYWSGVIARWQGDPARARAAFAAAREMTVKALATDPDNPDALSLLAMVDAGLGNKAEALAEARRACELKPVSQNAVSGPIQILNLANVEAWTGEKAAAVEHLTSLLKLPCIDFNYGMLELSPIWDPVRGDPGFEALLVSLAPKD